MKTLGYCFHKILIDKGGERSFIHLEYVDFVGLLIWAAFYFDNKFVIPLKYGNLVQFMWDIRE